MSRRFLFLSKQLPALTIRRYDVTDWRQTFEDFHLLMYEDLVDLCEVLETRRNTCYAGRTSHELRSSSSTCPHAVHQRSTLCYRYNILHVYIHKSNAYDEIREMLVIVVVIYARQWAKYSVWQQLQRLISAYWRSALTVAACQDFYLDRRQQCLGERYYTE